jgi:hypothetical protein
MIEIQYKKVKPYIKNLLIIYTLGFYLPFVYTCILINNSFAASEKSSFDLIKLYTLYALSFLTQTVFMVFEYAEIKFNGLSNYFSESWNYFDSSLYVFLILNIYFSITTIDQTAYGFYKLFNQVL